MRILSILFFVVVIMLSSCGKQMDFRSYYNDDRVLITPVPFAESEQAIEVFFACESAPDKPFVRIQLLRETMPHRLGKPEVLLRRLLERSRLLGAHGLIVLEQGSSTAAHADSDGFAVTEVNAEMWGVAFRYADDLRVREGVLSHLEVIPQGSKAKEPGGIIDIKASGELVPRQAHVWLQFVRNYSLEHLLYSQYPWEFAALPLLGKDSLYASPYAKLLQMGQFGDYPNYRRIRNHNVVTDLVQIVEYNKEKISAFEILMLNKRRTSEMVTIRYDKAGNVVQRSWRDGAGATYTVDRRYTATGRVDHELYSQTANNRPAEPILRVNYYYHSAANFRDQLDAIQVVNPAERN